MDERHISQRLQRYHDVVGRMDDTVALLLVQALGVFDALLRGEMSLGALSERCGVEARRLRQVLDIIVQLGFLEKKNNRYNLVDGDELLFNPESPWFAGLGFSDIEHFVGIRARSVDIIRGLDQVNSPGVGGETTAPERTRFLHYLHHLSIHGAEEVATLLSTTDVERILDMGCGLGTYAAALLRQLPTATATLFDRDNAREAVEAFMARQGLSDRAQFIGGDFLEDEPGNDFDLIILSNVIHCLNPAQVKQLLARLTERLSKNGRIAIKEVSVDDQRTGPPNALRFGFRMGLLGEGDVYPPSHVMRWFDEVGLDHRVALRLSAARGSYLLLGGRQPFKSLLAPRLKAAALKRKTRAVVLGGGIGGLATALALLRVGHEVEIYEKRLPGDTSGLGFVTLQNGLEALDQLGLGEAARRMGNLINRATIRNERGTILREETLNHALCMRRGDIIELLRSALPSSCLQFGKEFHELVTDETGLAIGANFTDGTQAVGDIFIGADGVRSKVRGILFPELDVNPVRIKELVHLANAPKLAKELSGHFIKTVHSDGGLAIGVLPCGFGQVVWFVQYDSHRYEMEGRSPTVRREFTRELIQDWPAPIPEVLARTDFSTGHIWRTTDFKPPRSFHRENVVLIGDAAHTMLTFASQGVGSALEDGLQLTSCLAELDSSNDYSLAFENFARRRLPSLDHFFEKGRHLAEQFLRGEDSESQIPLVHLPEFMK